MATRRRFLKGAGAGLKVLGAGSLLGSVNPALAGYVFQFQAAGVRPSATGGASNASLAAGLYHTAGLRDDGRVVAVGGSSDGQCDVGSWSNITAIASGWGNTVGLRNDGTVTAMGLNNNGQCNVSSLTNISTIACGLYHTLGLRDDATVMAVGENSYGQCNVNGLADIAAITAGGRHALAVKSDGTIMAAGRNDYDQLGTGTTSTMDYSSEPVVATELMNLLAV